MGLERLRLIQSIIFFEKVNLKITKELIKELKINIYEIKQKTGFFQKKIMFTGGLKYKPIGG